MDESNDAEALVRERLQDGWEVLIEGDTEVWAKVDETGPVPRIDVEPITPPEGLVLDGILQGGSEGG